MLLPSRVTGLIKNRFVFVQAFKQTGADEETRVENSAPHHVCPQPNTMWSAGFQFERSKRLKAKFVRTTKSRGSSELQYKEGESVKPDMKKSHEEGAENTNINEGAEINDWTFMSP